MNNEHEQEQEQQTGGGTPPGENPGGEQTQTDLTPQQMIDSLIEARGGLPPAPEGDDAPSEREQALIESNFQMETRFMLQDMQRVVDSKIPNASDQQSFAIAAAMTKGDLGDVIDAVIAAQQRAQEMDDKNEDLKELHVEGGASGKDEDKGKNLGIAGIFEQMSQRYSKPA
ncbi:MAG: hypothetical protein OXN27_04410 [Candidatus Poribacteria bacterium]|nr:hypothetical protein [Candidatus Poribacteria bacterium]